VLATPEFGANHIREEPSAQSSIVRTAAPGTVLTVTGGPACADGYVWRRVEAEGISGWTPEGSGDEHWLEPLGLLSYAEANAIAARDGRSYSHGSDVDLVRDVVDILEEGGLYLDFTPLTYEDLTAHGIWVNGDGYLAVFVVHYPSVGSAFFQDRDGRTQRIWFDLDTLAAW